MSARSSSRLYAEQLDLATPRPWQDLVPRTLLQQVAEEHGGDQADGQLTAPVHFWLLLLGVLSKGCSSLKDLISRCQARFGKRLGWLEGDKPWVTPAALSQRNRDRPVPFWQALYQRLRQHHFGAGWLRKAWQKKVGVIEAIDSSTFALMARLRHVFTPTGSGGARKGSRNPRGALKVHQVYNVGEEVPAAVGIGPAREHGAKGWKRASAGARRGVLYLIDRGCCGFPLGRAIDAAWSYFLTALTVGLTYAHVRWLNPRRQRDRVRDELVRSPGMDEGEDFVILRLVQVRQADGAWWSHVTDLVDEELAPADSQGLYRARWRVAIFFRHLQHAPNLGHWFAGSEAGVQAQLYAALIGYVLSQAVLLWASREARVAPGQFRFTTVVHELAEWLKAQLYLDQLLPREELLDRVRRNAAERDQRRNSDCFMEFAA